MFGRSHLRAKYNGEDTHFTKKQNLFQKISIWIYHHYAHYILLSTTLK
jgi:hypothetical protein